MAGLSRSGSLGRGGLAPLIEDIDMDTNDQILMLLGEIRGELVELRKLSARVRKLEIWQSWLKGGWAVAVAAYLYFYR
ncbi:MAG TPA: hypothetical protein VGK48_06485 [Terriglobia bacterium]